MMYDFADAQHASAYLGNTLVRHQGEPTYVHQTSLINPRGKKLQVHHYPLKDWWEDREVRVNPIEEFNFKPFRLGMMNFYVDGVIAEAAWMQRTPARRWKVGLDKHGVCVVPARKAEDNVIFNLLRNKNEDSAWFLSIGMLEMLTGKYPKLGQAIDMIGRRNRVSIAFSPNFAITGTRKLIYRFNEQPVGKLDGGYPVLNPDYRDLTEILQEDLHAQA
jgi:hypothetical protein